MRKRTRTIARSLRRTADRFAQRPMLLGCVVAAVGALLAWVAWSSVNGVPFQDRYKIEVVVPSDSPILKEGDAVRVAGRLAGFVTGVEPYEDNVKLTVEMRPAFAPIGSDARANVKVRSIVYLTYLEIFPGNIDDPMPEGGTIPLERSGSGVDLLEVAQIFDQRSRKAFTDAISTAGTGVAGRGESINAGIADLGALMPDLVSQTRAVIARDGAIARIIGGAARISRGLRGSGGDDVAAVLVSGAAVTGAIAARNQELGESIDLLRPFEDEFLRTAPLADPLLDDLVSTVDELRPATDALAKALPDVNELLALGDTFRTETIRITDAINPVLAAAAPVLRDLRPTVASIRPLLGPLATLVDGVAPYARDIRLAGQGLVSATSVKVPVGETAPNNVALRFAPVLTCHKPRDPYPDPGETLNHSESC